MIDNQKQTQNLDIPYNELTFLTTHNCFSNKEDGWRLYQQNKNISNQLNAGIRAFMIDIWLTKPFPWSTRDVYLMHGKFGYNTSWFFPLFKYKTLDDFLKEIKVFLEEGGNENEIVTIFIDTDRNNPVKTAEGIRAVKSVISQYQNLLFDPTKGKGFNSTLAEIIQANTRLIILSDYRGSDPHSEMPKDQFGLPLVWHYANETEYGNKSLNSDTWANLRAESADSKSKEITLNILNHFPDLLSLIPLNYPEKAAKFFIQKNSFNYLADHVIDYKIKQDQVPNFVAIDMFEIGADNGPQKIVDYCNAVRASKQMTIQLCGTNGEYMTAESGIINQSQIYCIPGVSPLEFSVSGSLDYCLLSTKDAKGNIFYLSYTASQGALELYNTSEGAHFSLELVGNMTYKIQCADLKGQYVSLYGNRPYLNHAGANSYSNYWTLKIDNATPQLRQVQISTTVGEPNNFLSAQSTIANQSKIFCLPSPSPTLLTFEILGPLQECVLRVTGIKETLFLSFSGDQYIELYSAPTKFKIELVEGTSDIYTIYLLEDSRYMRLWLGKGSFYHQVYASGQDYKNENDWHWRLSSSQL